MVDVAPQNPSQSPWRFREVRPGPRGRLFDLLLLLEVVISFALTLGAWTVWRSEQLALAGLLSLAAAGVPLVMTVQVLRMRRYRELARRGGLAVASVIGTRRRWMAFGSRADSRWPRPALPGLPLLEVLYEFESGPDAHWQGTFLISKRQWVRFRAGKWIEVFYDLDHPRRNACTLVVRWYYRLSGAEPVEHGVGLSRFGADPLDATDLSLDRPRG